MSRQFYKFVMIFVSVVASSANDSNGFENWKTLSRIVNECVSQDDVSICFKMKAVSFLDRLVRAHDTVPITDYLSIASDPTAPKDDNNGQEPGTPDLEATLPRSLEEKSQKLNDMIFSKLFTLATTKKLEYQLPADLFEGRKKRDRNMMMMMAAAGGMMMKMGMGMIGMIASKAFIISKVALILALIMLLKKSQGGGGGSAPQVVYAESGHGGGSSHGGGGGGYKRYIDAQTLAYGSQPQDF